MQGGFSIREYTLKMRSVNVMNCWPFDETFSEESVKLLLPPIVVKRFTWWIDETTEKFRQSERETKRVFEKGETSSRIVDRDLECDEEGVKVVKAQSLKGKIRATKKRSMVELFAVAPPIKRAEEKTRRRKKKRNKKMKNTDVILRKALRVVKKIKRKKAAEKGGGGGGGDGIGVTDKDNSSNLKRRDQEEATGNSSSSCCKESDNEVHNCVSNSKRKPRLHDFGPYKNVVPCKNQHSEIPKRGILKHQGKEVSPNQSKKCLLQKTVQSNVTEKHVTFLENDELLRPSRRPSYIGSVDCAVAVGKDLTRSESSGNEQLTIFDVDSTTLEKQNYEREYGSSERSAMCYRVDQDWSHHAATGFLHKPRDVYYNGHNVKVITTSSNTSCSIFPPLCFEDYLRTHNVASMSHLSHMKRTENTALNCAPSLHFQTNPPLYPNELLLTRDIHVRSRNGINDEFVGLPLNSQGELIALNSNVSASHIGLSPPSNAVSESLDIRTSRNQLNLFPVESYVKENAMPAIPSRLGIIESQCFDFPEINHHQQKGHANEKCHSTMRLMGKEFEVGCRSVHGIEDGHMWKDKQIINEFHFRNEPSYGEMRETLFFPSEITVNHRSESKCAQTQTSSTYKSAFLTRTVDCCPSHYPDTYSEGCNSKSLSEPFTTGYNSQLFTREHQRLCSNMSNKQNLHYSPISTINFPFMHPDLDSHGNSSWARRSCLDISEKGPHLSNSQSYRPVYNHPYPSVSALQSMTPAPISPPPYYPNKIKERMKSRIGIRELNICKKSKGQASGFHEGLQYAIRNMEDASRNSRFVMTGEYDQTNKDGQTQTTLPFMNYILKTKDQDIPLSATNIGFRSS